MGQTGQTAPGGTHSIGPEQKSALQSVGRPAQLRYTEWGLVGRLWCRVRPSHVRAALRL